MSSSVHNLSWGACYKGILEINLSEVVFQVVGQYPKNDINHVSQLFPLSYKFTLDVAQFFISIRGVKV